MEIRHHHCKAQKGGWLIFFGRNCTLTQKSVPMLQVISNFRSENFTKYLFGKNNKRFLMYICLTLILCEQK